MSRRRHCALPDYMHKIVLFSGETFSDRFYLPIADDNSRAELPSNVYIYVLLYINIQKRATRERMRLDAKSIALGLDKCSTLLVRAHI